MVLCQWTRQDCKNKPSVPRAFPSSVLVYSSSKFVHPPPSSAALAVPISSQKNSHTVLKPITEISPSGQNPLPRKGHFPLLSLNSAQGTLRHKTPERQFEELSLYTGKKLSLAILMSSHKKRGIHLPFLWNHCPPSALDGHDFLSLPPWKMETLTFFTQRSFFPNFSVSQNQWEEGLFMQKAAGSSPDRSPFLLQSIRTACSRVWWASLSAHMKQSFLLVLARPDGTWDLFPREAHHRQGQLLMNHTTKCFDTMLDTKLSS